MLCRRYRYGMPLAGSRQGIDLPQYHAIAFMSAIARSTKQPWSKPGQVPLADVPLEDSFS
jgi:hypothetical protein